MSHGPSRALEPPASADLEPHLGEIDPTELPLPGEAQLRTAATGFALLADPSRLRVLWVLAHGAADVGTLASVTGVSASGVSQHLEKLRLAGLVVATRDGRRQVYTVQGGHVRRLVLEALGHADHQVTGLPDDR